MRERCTFQGKNWEGACASQRRVMEMVAVLLRLDSDRTYLSTPATTRVSHVSSQVHSERSTVVVRRSHQLKRWYQWTVNMQLLRPLNTFCRVKGSQLSLTETRVCPIDKLETILTYVVYWRSLSGYKAQWNAPRHNITRGSSCRPRTCPREHSPACTPRHRPKTSPRQSPGAASPPHLGRLLRSPDRWHGRC